MAKRRPGRRKKRRTREHVIADLSVNHIERYILQSGFSIERVEHDYGIDLLMFTYDENGEVENGHVEFQLKATDRLRLLKDKSTVALRIEFADVFFWSGQPLPVILAVYDAVQDRAYWLHVQEYLESQEGLSRLEETSLREVTFHIPTANRLDRTAVERFRGFRDTALSRARGGIR